MADWEDPIQRAAVWYVAAFGAVTAVLIAGASLTSFDVTSARHPVAACLVAVAAVGAASWVGFAASRVLAPRWTGELLTKCYEQAAEAVANKPAPDNVAKGSWQEICSGDLRDLAPLYVEDGFNDVNDSPRSLWAQAQDGDAKAVERLGSMVAAANRRSSRRAFRLLRFTAPAALAVILTCALTWGWLSSPESVVATTKDPIPVTVRLASAADPTRLFGVGCSERERDGVAIDGTLPYRVTVAMPATDSCRAVIMEITPDVGSVTRA